MTNRLKLKDHETIWLIIILVVFIPVNLLVANIIVSKQDYKDSDFFTFWLAGRMQIDGQSPYDAELWKNNHHVYGADWISDFIFPHPLPLSILFIPMGWMSLKSAFILWVFLSQIFIVASIFFLLFLWRNPIRKHYIFPFIGGAIIFRPILVNLHNGQLAAFLLFVITLAVYFWKREKYWLGGALLVLVELKTNIGLFIVLFTGIWLITRKKFSMIVPLVIFSFIIMLAGMVLDPVWVISFINFGITKFHTTFGYSSTVWGLAGTVCSHRMNCTGILGGILALIILCIMNYFLLKKINTATLAISLIISGVLLITPYVWAYDQTLLFFSIVIITIFLHKKGYSYLLTAVTPIFISIISIVVLFASINIGNDSVSALTPLICFALTLYCASKMEQS